MSKRPSPSTTLSQMKENVDQLRAATAPEVVAFIDTCVEHAPILVIQYTILQLLQIKSAMEKLGLFDELDKNKAN